MTIYRTLPENAIERDRWGRPLLPTGRRGSQPFTRVSTIAKALDDQYNLIGWKSQRTLVGAALKPDLLPAAYAARDNKQVLSKLADEAATAGGAGAGAMWGTAVHAVMADVLLEKLDPAEIPFEPVAVDVDAIAKALAPYVVLGSEIFVADAERMIAGTTDLVLYDPTEERSFVADLKTSSGDIKYLLGSTAIQLAAYANCRPWWPGEGYLDWPENFDARRGLLIHAPMQSGLCEVRWLDLSEGLQGLELALEVRAWRSAMR